MNIAFYNLENFFDTVDDKFTNDDAFTPDGYKHWSEERYLEKLEHIASSLASIDKEDLPVLIGVAEVENKTVLTDLIYQPQFKNSYDFIHYDSPDKRGIDVALLFNKNYFRVREHKSIMVNIESEPDFRTRDILYVKGDLKEKQEVHLFVNHWPSRREGVNITMHRRVAAAQTLYAEASGILNNDPNAAVILMGDFNDLPVSNSITNHLHSKPYKNITTDQFYNLASIPHKKKMGSLYVKGKWQMYDQILVSKGMLNGNGPKIKADRLTILFNKELMFFDKARKIYRPNRSYSGNKYHAGYSDHLPVFFTLEDN